MRCWLAIVVLPVLAAALAACGGTAAGPGAVGDFVWLDGNGDGLQQDSEPGVPGVQVTLHTADRGVELAATVSDSNGAYSFDGVDPGEYRLYFDPPPEYDFTRKDQGDDALDSDAEPSGPDRGWTDPFEAEADGDSTLDAGLVPVMTALPSATPVGKVGGGEVETVTPTPTLPEEGEIPVCILVTLDRAGHATFIRLGDRATITFRIEGTEIVLDVVGQDPALTNITLRGEVDLAGGFTATGTGTVAGFPGIAGQFEGQVTFDADGNLVLSGTLVLGLDGKLPQGEAITYALAPC